MVLPGRKKRDKAALPEVRHKNAGGGNQKTGLNLQEPKVFDCKRRKLDQVLLRLP